MTHQNIESFHPPLEQRVEELLALSDLFSKFMKVERATYRDGRPETDGEHTLHTMFLAVAYTARYHPEFDPSEVAMLLMIHDLDEVFAGGVNSLMADATALAQKEANEARDRQRLRDIFKDMPYILELLEKYWDKTEPIVQYVYSFEKIDPGFAHLRDGGEAIRVMGVETQAEYDELDKRAIARMAPYAPPDILGIRRIVGQLVMANVIDTV